ncbi:MAG: DUF4325 domain-containing protein, partial [Patescibacteria group bacterium]|nr:DUF4325 domain-containing protein [Patescibacteria group bacterium]
ELLQIKLSKTYKNEDLDEFEVLKWIIDDRLFKEKLKENISSIFEYAFTEMLNNAIEHSLSERVKIEVRVEKRNLIFEVRDFGVGVFRNVKEKRSLNSEIEAIQDLLKGKTTTAPRSHSGEGIFFTSKVADIFILESFDYRLRVDNLLEDVFVEELPKSIKGTLVRFCISVESTKHLKGVFEEFQVNPDEPAFDKTETYIKLYTLGTIYISRSQARRLLTGLEKFKEVVLDFQKVPTIGQAFADEVFRVYNKKHPEVKIVPKNMSDNVRMMVDRVGED